jgi:hypothetical protein
VASIGAIEQLHASYKEKAHIYVVYIREAHPTDGRAIKGNKFQITDPKSLEERRKVAWDFASQVKLSIPILVDTIDDQVNRNYAGWPDRIYIIDAAGKIVHKGAPGPGGFTPSVRAAPGILDKLLGTGQ